GDDRPREQQDDDGGTDGDQLVATLGHGPLLVRRRPSSEGWLRRQRLVCERDHDSERRTPAWRVVDGDGSVELTDQLAGKCQADADTACGAGRLIVDSIEQFEHFLPFFVGNSGTV